MTTRKTHPATPSAAEPALVRYECAGLSSLTPIVKRHRGGVYVLEFADGTQYVGQAVDFAARMTTHIRGGGHHHGPWADIVAVSLMTLPPRDMNGWERELIARKRDKGVLLRNKALHFRSAATDSPLDQVLPVVQQRHWANGGGDYNLAQYIEASRRAPGPATKLLTSPEGPQPVCESVPDGLTRAGAVIAALARIISQAIPDAPALEGTYWTLSDYPDTAYGRFSTLNVGNIEFAFFPRWGGFPPEPDFPHLDAIHVSLPAGALENVGSTGARYAGNQSVKLPGGVNGMIHRVPHGPVLVDSLTLPTLDFLTHDWGLDALMRPFVIDLMRRATARKFTRFHSAELTRLVYEKVVATGE